MNIVLYYKRGLQLKLFAVEIIFNYFKKPFQNHAMFFQRIFKVSKLLMDFNNIHFIKIFI